MAENRVGSRTIKFSRPICVKSAATVVGRKEGEGPLGSEFDVIEKDNKFGQKSFEQAEVAMLQRACKLALHKKGVKSDNVQLFLAGDLLNQIITANYVARELSIPFFGTYGACSTFCEVLTLGGVFLDGGYCDRLLVSASSHHETAERQYRYPTEFGGQRPPEAQWTVTGAGAALLEPDDGPHITYATIGTVQDLGIKDPNNMGAAMAPAACDTIVRHLSDTGRQISSYDLVITGDLGKVGHKILIDLLEQQGVNTRGANLADAGMLIFSESQDTHAGGSGCGCSAVVFLSHVLPALARGQYRKVLLCATGALHSPCSVQQGESIPGIAHAVAFESP